MRPEPMGYNSPPNWSKFWDSVAQGVGLGAGIAIGGALIVNFLPKHVKIVKDILKKA